MPSFVEIGNQDPEGTSRNFIEAFKEWRKTKQEKRLEDHWQNFFNEFLKIKTRFDKQNYNEAIIKECLGDLLELTQKYQNRFIKF